MTSECPTCGDEFANEQGMKVHHTRKHGSLDETTCDECGSTFIPSNNSYGKYCSLDCVYESQREEETRECEMCERSFSVKPSQPKSYCCRSCWDESQHNRPRPEDVDSLLWLLYTYEGFGLNETYRRQRAVLGYDERLHKDEVHERIRELGLTRQREYWTLKDMDPEDVGLSASPEGDESYKNYYGQRAD